MSEHPPSPSTPSSATAGERKRHLAIVLFSILLVMQLVPTGLGPVRATPTAAISAAVPVPAEIDGILRQSCYDCHSSTVHVPWYGFIQPIGGWIGGHVREGRRELNFDAFASYRPRRQYVKLEQIAGEVRSGAMPLPSYVWMHGDARLSDNERALLLAWVDTSRAHLESRFPPDSLRRRR